MRYVTIVVKPVERIHPSIPAVVETRGVTPIAIEQTRLLDDGTEMTLFRARGDLDRLRTVLAEHPAVLDVTVAGEREGLVTSHSEPHELAVRLLELRSRHEVVVQHPIRFTDDGGLRVTLLGDDDAFADLLGAVPADLDVELERTGDYTPGLEAVFAGLTDRQREILRTAISEGYYESPRRCSQSDIAALLEIAPGTVSEHLRRIESSVFSAYVPGSVTEE